MTELLLLFLFTEFISRNLLPKAPKTSLSRLAFSGHIFVTDRWMELIFKYLFPHIKGYNSTVGIVGIMLGAPPAKLRPRLHGQSMMMAMEV